MLNRRLMMAQKKAGPPPGGGIVQEGLIFRLIGSDRGGIPGHWIEKINGFDYELLNCEEFADHIRMSGVKDSYGVCSPGFEYRPSHTGTIEAAYNTGSDTWCLFTPGGFRNREMNFGCFRGSILHCTQVKPEALCFLHPKAGGNFTTSVCDQYAYTNKYPLSVGKPDFYSGGYGKTYIGNPGYAFKGDVFEIRIYDRQLTEPEILQNQQHDIDTYFGGVIPE